MKAFVLFLMLLTAQSVGAQTVNQPFTVSWDYSANTQTGFRIERAAPDGGFITIVTLPDTARSYVDYVSGSPGDIFSWRIVAFNPTQISQPSSPATGTIAVITTVSPPAPSVVRIVKNKTQCTFTLTGAPPDTNGGWTVQFRYNTDTNFGSPDSTSPYSVAANSKNGSYDFWGTWTKSGQPTLQSRHSAGVCP